MTALGIATDSEMKQKVNGYDFTLHERNLTVTALLSAVSRKGNFSFSRSKRLSDSIYDTRNIYDFVFCSHWHSYCILLPVRIEYTENAMIASFGKFF